MIGSSLPAEIIARFRSVALERLERVEAGWCALLKGAGHTGTASEMQHELHTLKGDARIVGFVDVHTLSHKLEELLAAAHAKGYVVSEEFDLVVTMAFRFMTMLLRKKEGAALGGIDVEGFVAQINDLLADARTGGTRSKSKPPARPSSPPPSTGTRVEAPDRVSASTQQSIAVAATEVYLEHLSLAGRPRARLYGAWRALSRQVSSFCAAHLGSTLRRHEEAARELARDLGKEVVVALDAGDLWVRADVAGALDTAVLHILRNAIDHGIEAPEDRRRAGKCAAGHIHVKARVYGESVEVLIEDDGRGVDLAAVRARGITMGLLSAADAGRASDEELIELLFHPGFSTRTRVTEVSGRGIGLDAVRSALSRTGGRISLSTRAGKGATAALEVPRASRQMEVQCFQARRRDIVLAVPATFRVEPATEAPAAAFDPLSALDITTATREDIGDDEGLILALQKDELAFALHAGSLPYPTVAERLCPTGEQYPVEVILLNGVEALLLRPERLVGRDKLDGDADRPRFM